MGKLQPQTQNFETHDFGLASYLYCQGVTLLKINRDNPRRCIFVFNPPSPELFSQWQSGQGTVNALAFYNAFQTLKAKIFEVEG